LSDPVGKEILEMSRSILCATRILPAFALLALAACGDSTGVSGTARVTVLLTDAPSDYVGAALVDIGAVELRAADDGDHVVLTEDATDGPVNLLDLQGATTALLAEAEVEAGTYSQIRLFVESASVTLAEGYEFRDGSTEQSLKVPSGAQSGIKLNLRSADEDGEEGGGVEISSGETILVLDFDVNQSFRVQGNPHTPAGINSMHFQPTLRVVVQDVAGSISGTVSTELQTSVAGLVVTAEPTDEGTLDDFQTRTATAVTDSIGGYTIHYVVPGSYSVTVTPSDSVTTTTPASVDVTVEPALHVTGIDFSLVQITP
jgi:hypothetical protein